MAKTLSQAPDDKQLGTTLAEVIAAPSTGSAKRVALTVCNIVSSDATVDLTRYDGTNDRYILRNVTVSAGRPVVLREIFLTSGFSLRARASAGAAIDFTADVVTQTVT